MSGGAARAQYGYYARPAEGHGKTAYLRNETKMHLLFSEAADNFRAYVGHRDSDPGIAQALFSATSPTEDADRHTAHKTHPGFVPLEIRARHDPALAP